MPKKTGSITPEEYYRQLHQAIDRYEEKIIKAIKQKETRGMLYSDNFVTINGVTLSPWKLIQVLARLNKSCRCCQYRERFVQILDISIPFHRQHLLETERILLSLPGAKMPQRPETIELLG